MNSSSQQHVATKQLTSHYLSSLLPFQSQTISHPKQFTKTKQFYKPEQFIWNNPHRTSKRMYPYYHQFNENFQKNIKPVIDQKEEKDRLDSEQERIHRLRDLRKQTRTRFHSRQQVRNKLQAQAGIKNRQNSVRTELKECQQTQKLKNTKSISMKTQTNFHYYPSPKSPYITAPKSSLSLTQKSYNQGVQEYDQHLQKIKQIFTQQMIINHNAIRSQFKARKQANEMTNSRIRNGSYINQHHATHTNLNQYLSQENKNSMSS